MERAGATERAGAAKMKRARATERAGAAKLKRAGAVEMERAGAVKIERAGAVEMLPDPKHCLKSKESLLFRTFSNANVTLSSK